MNYVLNGQKGSGSVCEGTFPDTALLCNVYFMGLVGRSAGQEASQSICDHLFNFITTDG